MRVVEMLNEQKNDIKSKIAALNDELQYIEVALQAIEQRKRASAGASPTPIRPQATHSSSGPAPSSTPSPSSSSMASSPSQAQGHRPGS